MRPARTVGVILMFASTVLVLAGVATTLLVLYRLIRNQ